MGFAIRKCRKRHDIFAFLAQAWGICATFALEAVSNLSGGKAGRRRAGRKDAVSEANGARQSVGFERDMAEPRQPFGIGVILPEGAAISCVCQRRLAGLTVDSDTKWSDRPRRCFW